VQAVQSMGGLAILDSMVDAVRTSAKAAFTARDKVK
jgi:hypothetical protein